MANDLVPAQQPGTELVPAPDAETEVSTGESEIAAISPAALDELFNRDPANLLDSEVRAIAKQLRAQRDKWHIEEATKAPRAKAAPKVKPALPADGISLAALGLTPKT